MRLRFILAFLLIPCAVVAQIYDNDGNLINENGGMITDGTNRYSWGRDSTHTQKTDIPEGFFQWSIDERLGEIIPQDNDTIMFGFNNVNNTDGPTGQYSHLANLGSPRLSRLFFDRTSSTDAYVISRTYDFLRPDLSRFRFWNTKSPITNLSYHSAGDSELGEDRLRANFATNINKRAGAGFLLDYSYGRGYYANQGNSLFNGTLFGYYRGDRYEMHAWISANHFKTTENGGIEDDEYITNPDKFDRSFTSNEIPTRMSGNWNRNDDQTYYLTHRYNMGYYRDMELPDSVNIDSLMANDSLHVMPQEFVPVSSIIHTFRLRHLRHAHYGEREDDTYYLDNIYGTLGETKDNQYNTNISNTLGLSLREGFSKWAKAGLTVFVTHDYNLYHIPDYATSNNAHPEMRYVENDIIIGGSLTRNQGHTLHFNVTGDVALVGNNIGNFNIDGNVHLQFPLFKDTCRLVLHGYIKNNAPSFFWRHWHSQHAWWDKDLNKEFRARAEGTFNVERTRTRLRVCWENVSNYTYLRTILAPDNRHSYDIDQAGNAIQVLSVQLNQNLALGPLRWDNEIAWQESTNDNVLPLPTLSLYTNLYLHFKIAKILRIDVGADMRYWTAYHAPDYAPALNQYTIQDFGQRVKTGNHPIINCYVNAQMKRIRFYVSANHVNAGSHGGFYAPHYPIDPLNIHFGLSWNFVN